MTYYIQNRYQDSGWEYVDSEPGPIANLEATMAQAARMASNSICYGMVRVIDENGYVHRTWSAGETSGQYDEIAAMPVVATVPVGRTAADFQRDLMPQFTRSVSTTIQGQTFISIATVDSLLAEMQLSNLRQGGRNDYDGLLQALRIFLLRVEQNMEAA